MKNKKQFKVDNIDVSLPLQKKDLGADNPVSTTSLKRPSSSIISFPENAGSNRSFDLSPFYDQGYNPIVIACQRAISYLLEQSIKTKQANLSVITITSYCNNGIKYFFDFCTIFKVSISRDMTLEDITPSMIVQYIHYLKGLDIASTSQKTRYFFTKAPLVACITQGYFPHTNKKELFPKSPFPNNHKKGKGQSALTKDEKKQVIVALSREMKRIYGEDSTLTTFDLTVCVLAIGLSSGMNPTPVLELPVDCIQPHPLMSDRRLLVAYKRRGNSTQVFSLRRSDDVALLQSVKMNVADTIELIVERNKALRSEYTDPSRLLITYNQNLKEKSTPKALTSNALTHSIKDLINLYNLVDDDGKPMKLNMSRLRKTFVNRIWELSGQDPLIAARTGKHSVSVANQHYWEAPAEAEQNFKLLGEIRVKNLLDKNVVSMPKENTPIAGCKDIRHGDLAPKNGSICTEILGCFRCKSFVVTEDDLYRLFSFYWAVVRGHETFGINKWKKFLRHIMRIIDENIAPQFDQITVKYIRDKAQTSPHPYWRNLDMLRMSR